MSLMPTIPSDYYTVIYIMYGNITFMFTEDRNIHRVT